MLYPVIICGGAGSRRWPASRKKHPRPFLPLPDGQCSPRQARLRTLRLKGVKDVLSITNQEPFFTSEEIYQAVKMPKNCALSHIFEPFGRNTAVTIASAVLPAASPWATNHLACQSPDPDIPSPQQNEPGHKPRLATPDVIGRLLIAAQSSDYLGEDEIVYIEDKYGRL